jgi:hypothetical protein
MIVWWMWACTPDAEFLTVTPAEGSSFGYAPITLTLPDGGAEDVDEVTVGGIQTLDLEVVDTNTLRVTVQGSPTPGPARVDVPGVGTASYTYRDPVHPAFDRLFVIGASFSQGIQSGGLARHGQ